MLKQVTLTNVANGKAVELFDREFSKVLKNIGDESVPANGKREITLKFIIKTEYDRLTNTIEVVANSKLPGTYSEKGLFYTKNDHGKIIASTNNPEQLDLLDQLKEKTKVVANEG